jgi:hypothetical protein
MIHLGAVGDRMAPIASIAHPMICTVQKHHRVQLQGILNNTLKRP